MGIKKTKAYHENIYVNKFESEWNGQFLEKLEITQSDLQEKQKNWTTMGIE